MAYGISATHIKTGNRKRFGFFETKYEATEYLRDFIKFGNDKKIPYKNYRIIKLKESYS
jgi:hypothetical protein